MEKVSTKEYLRSNPAEPGVLLAIIVVSYNSKNYLEKCIDSIVNFTPLKYKDLLELVIVDNNSDDGSKQLIEEFCKKHVFIRSIINNENMGFAYANNQAIVSSSADYFFLLNSDTEVYENSLEGVLEYIKNDNPTEKIGILGPKIINSDGTIQDSCRKFPSLLNAAAHNILSLINPDNRFSRQYKMTDADRSRSFETDWVSGSAMLISKAALAASGLFDEKYFMYVEDVDLCYRMWKSGYKVIYYPEIKVLHHIGKSGENNPVRAQKLMQKSALRFFVKINKKSWKLILIPLVIPILGFRIVLTWIKFQNSKKLFPKT
ncbi:MAG TPA: glycosyl transferase family 2 [Actinobacteria bacterium]|nr:glycosyl transferase family 2 [Actinomycetota bacterium]